MLTPSKEVAFYTWLIVWGGIAAHVFTRPWQLGQKNKLEERKRELAAFERPTDNSAPLPRNISTASPYLRQAFSGPDRRQGSEGKARP